MFYNLQFLFRFTRDFCHSIILEFLNIFAVNRKSYIDLNNAFMINLLLGKMICRTVDRCPYEKQTRVNIIWLNISMQL